MATKRKVFYYGCAGCAVVLFLIVALVGGGIGYITYQTYRFGQDISANYKKLLTDYQQLDQKYAFTPPPDGILDTNRLDAFLNVRAQLADFTQTYQANLLKAGESIDEQFNQPGIMAKLRGISKIRELVEIAGTIGSGIGQEHIRLLTGQSMSVLEYRWYTQTSLGTLSKSKDNQFEPGGKCWDEYLKKFETARTQFKNVSINLHAHGIQGTDMNPERLLKKLEPVPYVAQNAEILQPVLERLLPAENATALDFLTLYYDELLQFVSNPKAK